MNTLLSFYANTQPIPRDMWEYIEASFSIPFISDKLSYETTENPTLKYISQAVHSAIM